MSPVLTIFRLSAPRLCRSLPLSSLPVHPERVRQAAEHSPDDSPRNRTRRTGEPSPVHAPVFFASAPMTKGRGFRKPPDQAATPDPRLRDPCDPNPNARFNFSHRAPRRNFSASPGRPATDQDASSADSGRHGSAPIHSLRKTFTWKPCHSSHWPCRPPPWS